MPNKDPQSKLVNQFIRLSIELRVQAVAKLQPLILYLRILSALTHAILLSLNQF
jgi:hypothetical protein